MNYKHHTSRRQPSQESLTLIEDSLLGFGFTEEQITWLPLFEMLENDSAEDINEALSIAIDWSGGRRISIKSFVGYWKGILKNWKTKEYVRIKSSQDKEAQNKA